MIAMLRCLFVTGVVLFCCLTTQAADTLFSFEDGLEGWTASIVDSSFDDPASELTVVEGPGNTDGAHSLKVVGRAGGFVRNTSVLFDATRIALFNKAVENNWNLQFDWTIVAADNPGASGYITQISIVNSTGWTQGDLYEINGFPAWDPSGPEIQTMTASVPLSKFGSGERGYSGVHLSSNSEVYLMNFAMSAGGDIEDTRTYYLDNFRLIDPRTPGDYDADGLLTASDIDLLSLAILDASSAALFDADENGTVDGADRDYWVHSLRKTYFGDGNLDGEFNSADLVSVFSIGKYEDAIVGNATWQDGDWDGNLDFDSGDFVVAFRDGGYEQGKRTAVAAVPEPSPILALIFATTLIITWRRENARCVPA